MASGMIKKDTVVNMGTLISIPANSSMTFPVDQVSWYFVTWTANIGSCFWIVASSGNPSVPFNCIKNIDGNSNNSITVTAGTGFNMTISNSSNYNLNVSVTKISSMTA